MLRGERFNQGLLIAVLCCAVPIAGRALLSLDQVPAHRDAGHYFAPLYQWQAKSIAQGEGILWDPYDDGGRSLAEDPTAATFYPLAWWLRIESMAWPLRWNGYLLAHLLIAAFGAAWGAKQLRLPMSTALVSGIVYSSAGAIVSQIDNVVYLVGAAWLPWALALGWQGCVTGSARSLLGASLGLALMILGGDPQGAVHAVLALGLAVLVLPAPGLTTATLEDAPGTPIGVLQRLLMALCRRIACGSRVLAIVFVAALLSAVQWVPSIDAAARSERAVRREARSLSEGVQDLARLSNLSPQNQVHNLARGMLAAPTEGTHQAFAMQFSLAPWQLAELLWPGASGQGYPNYRRWTDRIPAADRPWFASLYFGIIPLALALAAFRLRRAKAEVRWLSWGVLLFVGIALGWYGFGWLAQEFETSVLRRTEPWTSNLNASVGGVYWWVTLVVPGYSQFRYPAKAFVVAMLLVSWLVGFGLSESTERSPKRLGWILASMVMLSATALVFSWLLESRWEAFTQGIGPDGVFGPFDPSGAWSDLQRAIAQGLILSTVAWGCCSAVQGFVASRVTSRVTSRAASQVASQVTSSNSNAQAASRLTLVSLAVALLVIADTAIAHQSLIRTVSHQAWLPSSPLDSVVNGKHSSDDDSKSKNQPRLPVRVYRGWHESWTPRSWWTESSSQRFEEVIRWDRASWFPKHQRLDGVQLFETPGSSQDAVLWMTMHVARHLGRVRIDGSAEPTAEFLDGMSVEYLVVPSWDAEAWLSSNAQLELIATQGDWPEDVSVLRSNNALPRVTLVERAAARPLPDSLHLDELWQAIERILSHPDTCPKAWSQRVVLDLTTDELKAIQRNQRGQASLISSSATLTYKSHQRLECELSVPREGWLVIAESYAPGWQAEVQGADGNWTSRPVVRADLVKRAVPLRAGDQQLRMIYQPVHGTTPGIVSLLSSLVVTLLLITPLLRREIKGVRRL